MEKNGEITVYTSKRGTHIVMHKYDEWQGYGISDGISQSLENGEDEPIHGISDSQTDGRTDGSSDSRTDSTQEIRNNNANNEQEREYEHTIIDGTSMESLSDHERNIINRYGNDDNKGDGADLLDQGIRDIFIVRYRVIEYNKCCEYNSE